MNGKKSAAAAVVQETRTAVAVAQPDFGGFAGTGFENTGKDDLAIPFLTVLQGLSPEIKRSEGAYIEGALEGMVINTVTKQLIDTEKQTLLVIPCAYSRSFIEWRVREKGGGFVKEHALAPEVEMFRDDRGRDIMPNGNQLNDTRAFYVMVISEDNGVHSASPAVIGMTSTQIRKAKQWLMQQNLLKLTANGKAYTPPMFASKWKVETVPESNEKGSWYGWRFEHGGYLGGPTDPLFITALEFHKSVMTGTTKADMRQAEAKIDPETGEVVGSSAEGRF